MLGNEGIHGTDKLIISGERGNPVNDMVCTGAFTATKGYADRATSHTQRHGRVSPSSSRSSRSGRCSRCSRLNASMARGANQATTRSIRAAQFRIFRGAVSDTQNLRQHAMLQTDTRVVAEDSAAQSDLLAAIYQRVAACQGPAVDTKLDDWMSVPSTQSSSDHHSHSGWLRGRGLATVAQAHRRQCH